jgi:uncharacterized protein YbjT (DUF2867 family)
MSKKTLLLLGATGLVGGECLKRLISDDHYRRIVVLTRSAISEAFRKAKIEHHVINFDRIGEHKSLLKADHVLCALGSTIKKAGTKDQFYKVDFTYVYDIARVSAEQGAEHFLLVSSMGANPESRIFYNRVKGELEEAVQQLPFRSISIFRPSLILGNRKESRFYEEISKWAAGIFSFAIPEKYQPIDAADIACAMLQTARANRPGEQIFESDEIKSIAKAYPA